MLTESEALMIVSLDHVKLSLRIPPDIMDHDDLLKSQIVSAISHLQRTTGIEPADMPPALRAAAVDLVRLQYDGAGKVEDNPTFDALMAPWQSFKG